MSTKFGLCFGAPILKRTKLENYMLQLKKQINRMPVGIYFGLDSAWRLLYCFPVKWPPWKRVEGKVRKFGGLQILPPIKPA